MKALVLICTYDNTVVVYTEEATLFELRPDGTYTSVGDMGAYILSDYLEQLVLEEIGIDVKVANDEDYAIAVAESLLEDMG